MTAAKKPRTVVSSNYVRSDNKHKIANGTGRAGKSAKALRKEKWRLAQGVPRWKSKAAHAREKREQEQLALYNDCLTPAELAKQVAASVDADALALAGVGSAAEGSGGDDEGTDDELERLKALETAEFGQSSVRTRRDRAVEAVAAVEAARRDAQQDAEANMPAAIQAKLAAANSAAAAVRCNAQARAKDPSSYTSAALRTVLQRQFGYNDFRPGQLETIQRVLGCYPAPPRRPSSSSPNNGSSGTAGSSGSTHNVLSILPTGGGKSLIYQLLSYVLPGLTLVVSPLLSLMRDQLEHLPHFLPGAVWSSELDGREVLALMTRLQRGEIKVLFVSPEKLLTDAFQNFLLEHICEHSFSAQQHFGGASAGMAGATSSLVPLASRPGLSLCVVDEAHCMAEWSHNFRTAYARLDFVLRSRLRIPRILGLTATATTSTVAAVASHLRIDLSSASDGGIGGNRGGNVVRAPLRRSNLVLSSSRTSHEGRFQAILGLLSMPPFTGLHSIIIYVSFQKSAEALAKFLTQQGGLGSVAFYHGGLTLAQRHAVQSKFMRNKLSIVVATCAFGMGLDKRDIRGVVHAGMPRSLEAYVQEIGRAGRDGCLSYCHTLWDDSDEVIARSLMYTNGVDKHQLRRLLGQMIFTPQVAEALVRVRSRAAVATAGCDLMSDGAGEQGGDDDGDDCDGKPLSRQRVYVALNVEQLRTGMDLSEEVVGTILARLERSGVGGNNAAATAGTGTGMSSSSIPPWIRLVACVHNTASIGFHKTHPKVLAQTSPVIRALLEQNKWIQPSAAYGAGSDTIAFDHERAATNFTAASFSSAVSGLSSSHTPDFSHAESAQLKQQKGLLGLNMIDAAMALCMDVGAVQRELVRLRAAGEINVQWSDMSFLVQVLRCPSEENAEVEMSGYAAPAAAAAAGVPSFESVVESVHAFLQSQECSSATKLSIVSTALKIAALPSMRCTAADAVQRGRRMLAAHAKLMRTAAPGVIVPTPPQLPGGAVMTDTDPSVSPTAGNSSHNNNTTSVDEEPEYFDLHLVIDAYFQADDHGAFLAQLEAQLAEATLQDRQTRATGSGGDDGGGNTGTGSSGSSASSAAARAAAATAAAAAAVAKSHLQLEREVESDLASFVRSYGDSLRSGREVARIFHGLHAPSAAAQSRSAESAARFQARRDPHNSAAMENGPSLSAFAVTGSPYWGRHRAVPFPQVLALAERALQEYKLGAPERAVQHAEEARVRREQKRQKLASHVHLAPPPPPKPLLPPSRSITAPSAAAVSPSVSQSSACTAATAVLASNPADDEDGVLVAASEGEEDEAESDEY